MENPATGKQEENTTTPKSVQDREKEFSEAVERVYRKYGNDLSAFLRDIQKERELVKRG